MKHIFVSFLLCSILFVGTRCSREDEVDMEPTPGLPLTVQAEATGFSAPSEPTSTRIPLESGLETLFNKDDAIGVFAVKNGAIANGVNNIKLTYVKTSLTTGDWNPPTGTTLYWSEGVSYIAYYPYKEGVSIDATRTPAEIVASLSENEKLKPLTDQSDPEKYTACDLMTAVGEITEDAGSSTKKILKFTLTHRYTLLVLKPQARFTYVSPDQTVFTYRNNALSELTVDVTAQDVIVNGVKACKMDDGSYRAIVLPTATPTRIAGNYTTADVSTQQNVTMNYAGSETTLDAGTCHTLTVQSPQPNCERVRDLAPGDFVFVENNRIEIFPGDAAFSGETIPDAQKAMGMVITCDPKKMTDTECIANGWTHAYVMGLENVGVGSWGDPTVNDPSVQEMTQDDPIEYNMNGYSETQAMLAAHEANMDRYYTAFKRILEHRAKNPLPNDICSPWFLPSIGQWCDMLVNICGRSPRDFPRTSVGLEDLQLGTETKEKLVRQLAKVGATLGDMVNYRHIFQCSTEYNTAESWILIWHFEKQGSLATFWDRIGVKGFNKASTSSYNVRPFFAF